MNPNTPLPFDVRLINIATTLLTAGVLLSVVWVAVVLLLRSPLFALREVVVRGDVVHNNASTLRAQLGSQLAGSFVAMDLDRAREAVEAVPWIRKAVVRREFPRRLHVEMQEHQAVALWGNESEPRLVNTFGEVFEANVGDVEQDGLPRLSGPVDRSAVLLSAFRLLQPQFAGLDIELAHLELTERGNWLARLDSGAVLQLGRGTGAELAARVAQFLTSLPTVAARHGRRPEALESADLRHKDGYAIRLRGVSTRSSETQKRLGE
jgi:cell division protein FtsQ